MATQFQTSQLLNLNDACALSVSGTQYATVQWSISQAGSGAITAEYTTEPAGVNALNWLPAPYSKRTDVQALNPSVQPWAAQAPVIASFETPLPADVTAFRLRYSTAGSLSVATITLGRVYVPGMPVAAVLYDVTEGSIGAGLASPVLNMDGWEAAQVQFATPTTQVWTYATVDDGGAAVGPGFSTTAASSASVELSQNAPALAGNLGAGAIAAAPFGDRRFKLTLPAGGTVSQGRARVVARR